MSRRRDQKKHRKIDENEVVSGRESSDSTLGFLVYSENRPFQKSVPRSTSKDLPNRAHFGPEFRKCLKKGGHEKGSKTGAPKSYFLGPKRPLGPLFENAKSIISPRVRSGLQPGGNREGKISAGSSPKDQRSLIEERRTKSILERAKRRGSNTPWAMGPANS